MGNAPLRLYQLTDEWNHDRAYRHLELGRVPSAHPAVAVTITRGGLYMLTFDNDANADEDDDANDSTDDDDD
eukprot:10144767-Heterocapsa_arctica.AAC.1